LDLKGGGRLRGRIEAGVGYEIIIIKGWADLMGIWRWWQWSSEDWSR
jgi:hypothetical protein